MGRRAGCAVRWCQIPIANLTSPLWPHNFTVDEKASLTFPGRDPCNVKL